MAQPGGLTLRFAVHLVFTGTYFLAGWFGSRVVSVLDSSAEGPGFKSQPCRCRITVLGKLFTPIVSLFTKQRIGSSPLDGCEGNCRPGSLPPGLWLKSPAGWLRKTGISSGTLCSVIEYGLPLAFFTSLLTWLTVYVSDYTVGYISSKRQHRTLDQPQRSLHSASYARWQRGTARIRPPHACRAAIDRYLMPAGPTAANL